jgi:hypothetical protein
MKWKPVIPTALLVLLGCEGGPSTEPLPPASGTGVLTVVLDYDRDSARLAGADSALVLLRNIVPDKQFSEIMRVPLHHGSEEASVDLELRAEVGHHVAVLAYSSATGEAFAVGELDHTHAVIVQPDQRRSLPVHLPTWRAQLTPPASAHSGQTARYSIRIFEGQSIAGRGSDDLFVSSFNIRAAFGPWTPEDQPEPAPFLSSGMNRGGSPPETTYLIWYNHPEVAQDTLMYVQGFFVIGGVEWQEAPGAGSRTFRLSTALQSVPLVAAN